MKKLVDTFPKSITERVFVVRTALDINMQQRCRGRDRKIAPPVRPRIQRHAGRDGADGTDGAVRAMVGGRDYGESQFNRATEACASRAPRSSPTSMPPRSMNGFKPNSIVVDGPVCIGNWCPHNYGGGYSAR